MPEPEKSSATRPQRRYRRRHCGRRILVSYRHDDRHRLLHGRCLSLSPGGIGAVIDGYLENGQRVAIEFTEMESEWFRTLRLQAQVRYQDGFRHGFEFISPTRLEAAGLVRMLHDRPSS